MSGERYVPLDLDLPTTTLVRQVLGPARARPGVNMHDELEVMTLAELAKLAKRSRRTLDRDIAAGRLETIKIGPRATRVTLAEAERYLAGGNTMDPSQPLDM